MMTAAEARAALQAALATQNPALILAARQVLASAEDGEDESVDGQRMKRMKKTKKVVTETEEAEAEDAEESEAEAEDAEEEEHSEPDGDEEPEPEETEGEDAEESEEEEAEEAKEAKKSKKAKSPYEGKAAKGSVSRLLAVLGAKSLAEAIGRATAAAEAMGQLDKLSKRLAKLEGEKRAAKVERLFSAAQREGRVVRAEVSHLKAAFKGRPLAELEAYLAAKPRVVSSEFAQESAANYPSQPLVGQLATPGAAKAMALFGVSPEQMAQRAAERGINPGFPGSAGGNK